MKKQDLKEKVDVAWYRVHKEDGGYEKFITFYNNPEISQEAIADKFGVSWSTVQRWGQEYKQLQGV